MKYHSYRHDNDSMDDSDFPCVGFLAAHILGAIFIFIIGAKFAIKRAPLLPMLVYRLMRVAR